MKYGNTIAGAAQLDLTADRVYLFDVGGVLASPLVVGSVAAYLDGNGPGSGQQVLRPVIMEAGVAATLTVGNEVTVTDGQAAGWVHMTFDLPPFLRAGVEPRIGFSVGPASTLARLFCTLASPGVSQRFTSAYGATPNVSGSATDVNALASVLAIGVVPWAPPAGVTEEDLSDLPIDVASGVLTGADASVVESAACGWHYSNDAPPPPATAIVRTGGPLEALVGERIRVTADTPIGPASIVVRVADELPFDGIEYEDLSLTRDAFMRLGGLWASTLTVQVAVIA